jgi:hypothetical protein
VSVKSGNEILEIYSAHSEPGCVSGDSLSSTGIRINNVVAAGSTSVSASTTAGTTCSITNASGVATWSYKAQQKGTYPGISSANLNGAGAKSNPVTFTAK